MNITVHTCIGQFDLTAELSSVDDADKFVAWVYALEGREERAAIQHERAPIEHAPEGPASEEELIFTDEPAPAVTADEAVAIVKAFAATGGTVRARELMQQLGIARTSEITDELAPRVAELFKGVA